MAFSKRVIDWTEVRKEFVEAVERPTFAELSERHSIAVPNICVAAADQGWIVLRARRLEALAIQSDVNGMLIAAAKNDAGMSDRFRSAALNLLQKVEEELGQMEGLKRSARLNTMQTCGFIMLNCANALKSIGLGGLPKGLLDRMDAREGSQAPGWRQGVMQQINVAVSVAQALQPKQPERVTKVEPVAEPPQNPVE